jgi:hypothetical protein
MDARLTGCLGRCGPLTRATVGNALPHPAVVGPAELVGRRDARRGALGVVPRLHPALGCDLQRVLPVQRLGVGPLPVALGFRLPGRRATG